MPTAVANCSKPKFTLVTRPQGRTRYLKISNIGPV